MSGGSDGRRSVGGSRFGSLASEIMDTHRGSLLTGPSRKEFKVEVDLKMAGSPWDIVSCESMGGPKAGTPCGVAVCRMEEADARMNGEVRWPNASCSQSRNDLHPLAIGAGGAC